ncbi:MAG: class I SAM-dependent methyltransferase [Prosthecobacter sp.]|nr:class I SAM-dependent methyltransferase [Prosthecobacter sp.]
MSSSHLKETWQGFSATRVYLPLSMLSKRLRRFTRTLRGKRAKFAQITKLPAVSWKCCTRTRLPKIWETDKSNGNVRVSELAVLAALAADCEAGASIFEIGTFDGRTTLNLAMNSPASCEVYTLDLPPDVETKFEIAPGERHMIEKPVPGTRFEKHRASSPAVIARIHSLLGDSAAFDYTPYHGSCGLVFIDGSHAYDYAVSDTANALKLLKKGGVIVWHDYGVWEGVTRALEEMAKGELRGLRHIRGTTLAIWRDEA